MKPTDLIPQFDAFLAERGLALEAIATGGAVLALLGTITRETRDCDLIEPELSAEMLQASRAFAARLRDQGEHLQDGWLNNGPASLGPLLPNVMAGLCPDTTWGCTRGDVEDAKRPGGPPSFMSDGWRKRLQPIYQGKAIQLWALGRPELLLSKLWALCDRALDLGDCLALCPSMEELAQAEAWITAQDINPDWPTHVRATLQDLARRLGHGL